MVVTASVCFLWLAFASPVIAQTDGEPTVIEDPQGDAVNAAGDPVEGPDFFKAALVWYLASPEFWDHFFGGDEGTLVRPDEFGPELTAALNSQDLGALATIEASIDPPLPTLIPAFCQFVIALDFRLFDNYEGPETDPNTGHDTSFDLYRDNGIWVLGNTIYRDGAFSFTPDYTEFAAKITTDTVKVAIPASLLEGATSWSLWIICGDDYFSAGRDVIDLGDPAAIPFLTFQVEEPTTATTATDNTSAVAPETTSAPTTTQAPTTTEAPAPEPSPFQWWWLILVLFPLGLIGWFLMNKKPGEPCNCDAEHAAWEASQAELEQAVAAVGEAMNAVDAANAELSAAQNELRYAGIDNAPAEQMAELEASIASLTAKAEAAAAAEQAASERRDALETRTRALWNAYQDCLERCREINEAAGTVGSTQTRTPPGSPTEPSGTPIPPVTTGGPGPASSPPPGGSGGCEPGDTNIKEGTPRTFTIPGSGLKMRLETDAGPIARFLDELDDKLQAATPGNMVFDLISSSGELEIPIDNLSPGAGQEWGKAIESFSVPFAQITNRQIVVVITYTLVEVKIRCDEHQVCRGGVFGKDHSETVEVSRVPQEKTLRWESISGARGLGNLITGANQALTKAREAHKEMQQFVADCQ